MRAVLFDAYPHVYGGAQRTNEMLAKGLRAHGWELLTVVTADATFTARLRAAGLPVEVVAVPAALGHYGRSTVRWRRLLAALALPAYWLRLARALRRHGPALVHAVDHRGVVLAAVPARLARARLVWHVQALEPSRAVNRFGRALAHQVVVPSAAITRRMPDLESRGRRVLVIPNVVAPEMRLHEQMELHHHPVIVSMGRLHPDKGFDVLVEALALVRERVPGAQLRIVGGVQEGYEQHPADLMGLAERRGVASAVELLGSSERPGEVLSESRLYVQASRERTETFGMAILEAMAMGLPVVATDVGGVADHVRDGETGLLVPPEDPEALAEAIVRSLSDDDEADRLRRAAADLAGSHPYTMDALVESFAGVYARLVGAPTVGR